MEINNYYRTILKNELEKRCEKNKSYSLRAFALYLQISAAQLSRVLSGKKNLSHESAIYISRKIFKRKSDREEFMLFVEVAISKNQEIKELAYKKLKNAQNLNNSIELELDTMNYISKWYHVAILDLTMLSTVTINSKSVASLLGIKEIEAGLAIERLLRLGLLKLQNGAYVKTHTRLKSTTGIPNESIKKFHRQMLAKAADSLDTQSLQRRFFMGKTMSIKKTDINTINQILHNAFSEISEIANNNDDKDALYQLNFQLFDLIKGDKK